MANQNRLRLERKNSEHSFPHGRFWQKAGFLDNPMSGQSLTGEYAPTFETKFLKRLKHVIGSLPTGAATLQIGGPSSLPETVYPSFLISPANQNSAPIKGSAAPQQGIIFTIGRATVVELGEDQRGEDRFFQICQGVFTSHFRERLIYISSGRVIHSRIVLPGDGRGLRLRQQQILWWLFPNKTEKLFSYQPYY